MNNKTLPTLLFIFAIPSAKGGPFYLVLEELVHCEGNGLAGGDTHYSRRDTLVERMHTFLSIRTVSQLFFLFTHITLQNWNSPKHIPRDKRNPLQRTDAFLSRCLL